MPPTAARSRALGRFTVAATTLGLVTATLALGLSAPAPAAPSAGLMITEVYPGGGNAGATYNADFVEPVNASSSTVSLAGKSLQYRANTCTAEDGRSVFALPSVSVPAHSYFLVKGGGGNGVEPRGPRTRRPPRARWGLPAGLPGRHDRGGMNPVTGGATVALGGSIDYSAGKVIDFLGYGTGTTSYEAATQVRLVTTMASRTSGTDAVDTDNNNTDFTISAVAPGPDNCDCVAPTLKITEVYTEGGSAGATYNHDYVEIHNPGRSAVPLSGLTLQYRAPGATGVATVAVPLTGTLGAGSYDVAQLASGGSAGAPVSGVDYTNATLDLATAGGTVFIAKRTAGYDPGTGDFGPDQFVADLVGWGSSNVAEDTAVDVAALDSATSLTRAPGAVDTDMNADDFTAAPNPNTTTTVPDQDDRGDPGHRPDPPMANARVATTGVVTAAYPRATGDFAGFYLQTAGHDAANDTTPDAADGIFVYTGGLAIAPAVGDRVTVAGKVTEFSGMTELSVSNAASFTNLGAATGADVIRPATVLPGTDCALPGGDCLTGAALEAEREKHEGELFRPPRRSPSATPTTARRGAGPAPAGSRWPARSAWSRTDEPPLLIATEVVAPSDAAGLADRNGYNAAHMITLDDGANVDYSTGSNRNVPLPWLTPTHTVRMGAAVTFPKPVVLDYRNSLWKLQPQGKVTGDGEAFVNVEQDRTPLPTTCSAPPATSRSPRSTCSTTSTRRARSGTTTARRSARTTATASANRSPTTPARRTPFDPGPGDDPARPARCGQPGELRAPGGQGARGDQHDGRGRRVAGGGRELHQDRRRRP